jgi:hypothetical protein
MEYSTLGKRDRDMSSYEAQEAARMGIDSARRLLQMLSHQHQEQQQQQQQQQQQCLQEAGGHGKERMMSAADADRCKFQKVQVSTLCSSRTSCTGHARFRRATAARINPMIAGFEYVFFQSANFAQEDELKRKQLSKEQLKEKETKNVKFLEEVPSEVVSAAPRPPHEYRHTQQQIQQQQHLQPQLQLQIQQRMEKQNHRSSSSSMSSCAAKIPSNQWLLGRT